MEQSILTEVEKNRNDLKTDKMDVSVGELINMYEAGELTINPSFQRLYNWKYQRKTDFIESLILGIPIPSIFVAEDANGIWEVVDGLQRITTLITFFDKYKGENVGEIENKFNLSEGSRIRELDGYNSDTLPQKIVLQIKRSAIRVEIIKTDSDFDMRYEVFKRLNTGGLSLNEQEMRNAIYRENLEVLFLYLDNQIDNFNEYIELIDISENKKNRLYHHEIFLRIISMLHEQRWKNINVNVSKNIDLFLNELVKKENADQGRAVENIVEQQITLFNIGIKKLRALDDMALFKGNNNSFSASLFEAIVIMTIEYCDLSEENLKKAIVTLKESEQFKAVGGTNASSSSRVKKRLEIADDIFSRI